MKFKVCKSDDPPRFTGVYVVYVRKWFIWFRVDNLAADTTDEVITKAREIAESYMKKPVVEFEL